MERQRKEQQGVSQTSTPPRNPRRGQRLSWNPKRSLTAKAFFLLDRARPVLFLGRQKENGGCIPAGKAGVVPALGQRDQNFPFGTYEIQTSTNTMQDLILSKKGAIYVGNRNP